MNHLPKVEGEPYTYQPWPSWATSPNGERRIFNSEGEVPAGWTHHGETKRGKPAPAPAPVSSTANQGDAGNGPGQEPPTPPGAGGNSDVELDAAGTPFDPERHTGTKVKSGLWRMKVGKSRPESEGTVKFDL